MHVNFSVHGGKQFSDQTIVQNGSSGDKKTVIASPIISCTSAN